MFFCRSSTQFAHLAEDKQFVGVGDECEVFQCRLHTRGVGVVGVHDKRVVRCLLEFRTLILGSVLLKRGTDIRFTHTVTQANGSRREHIVKVVRPHELGLHLVPSAASNAQTQAQLWRAGNNLTFYVISFIRFTISDGAQSFGNGRK